MKALLYKDLLALWKYLKLYLLMIVTFQLASLLNEDLEFMRYYTLILAAMLPNTLIAYDERDKWDRFALTLSVSRKQLVSVKYIVGLILAGAMFLPSAAVALVRELGQGHFDVFGYWFGLGMNLLLGLAVMCVALPFTFRLGAEKGRLANAAFGGILAAVLVASVLLSQKLGGSEISLNEWIMVPVLVLLILMLPASWALSVHWYEKREF